VVTQFESRVSASPDVMVRQVGEESVVLNLKTEQYMGLDDIATSMWNALTTSESVEAAYKGLAANYDVDGEQLRRDLDDFVQELIRLGLIAVGDQKQG